MTKFGIGQAVRRVEDQRFLPEPAQFVGDLALPRQCYGVAVLSPHAHARIIKRVDVSQAEAAPGVLCVLTGADAEADKIGGIPPHLHAGSLGWTEGFSPRFARSCSPTVSAASATASPSSSPRPRRRRAMPPSLCAVDYEPLPAVVDLEQAIAAGRADKSGADCPSGNVGVTIAFGDKAAVDAAFRRGEACRQAATAQQPRHRQCAIEPRTALGRLRRRRRQLHALHDVAGSARRRARKLASAVFNVPETKIRVLSPDVGGGFGMKANIYPDDVLVLWASRRCGRPVKWTATRSESLFATPTPATRSSTASSRSTPTERFSAIRATRLSGARRLLVGGDHRAAVLLADAHSERLRRADDRPQHQRRVHQHGADVGLSRRRPSGGDLFHRAHGRRRRRASRGIDRVELRRRNLIKPEALPYHTPTHHNYDSGEFERLMDQCLQLADWNGFRGPPQGQRNGAAKLRGRAVTPYIELGGVFNERMEIRFDPSGMVSIIAGTHSHGQGHATAFAQLVVGMARRPVRGDPLHPGRHREGRISAAAPSPRAARWSAARRCASPRTPSSPRQSRWRAR